MIGVLHTWGRNLSYHPHVHYLVPAGGLTAAGIWQATRADFLVPVRALSKLFRGKLCEALKGSACAKGIPAAVWKQAWVVHCEPVGSGVAALKYLAPYIFRVALSNNRLLKLAEGRVTFRYRDTDTDQERTCTLMAEEFIHRFLQHVLPKGFVKVRYYGLFSPGQRQRLAQVRQQLGGVPPKALAVEGKVEAAVSIASPAVTTALAPSAPRCPQCGQPMHPGRLIPPTGRAPP